MRTREGGEKKGNGFPLFHCRRFQSEHPAHDLARFSGGVVSALVSGHLHREGVVVTPWEAMAYDELCRAAGAGEVCPLNLDLEMMFGCNSASVAPSVVKRLERKGLIMVQRFQRFRRVKILATGLWTARSPSQHVERPHVPRGTRTKQVAAGVLAKKARRL